MHQIESICNCYNNNMITTYKGVEFPAQVVTLVKHMESLNEHRESLSSLSGTWDTLALLGHLSNLNTDMSDVRKGFTDLTAELLSCLAQETLSRVTASLGAQAQISIDVLTRNLFERTADIGFLATDTPIVDFCCSNEDSRNEKRDQIKSRFKSYVEKYSVYKDIVLMDMNGNVICRLINGFNGKSLSNIIDKCNSTNDGYVETYEKTDFCNNENALTYSYSVVDSKKSRVGVLSLHFDLTSEVGTIFNHLNQRNEVIAFVDKNNEIIISSDRHLLPQGNILRCNDSIESLRLSGTQYIVSKKEANPFQGYSGPGWSAVALILAEAAFENNGNRKFIEFEGEKVFSKKILEIPTKARSIQFNLDRLVWNGRVKQVNDSNSFSRSLLEEIASTGRKTKDVFEKSSTELLSTVTQSLLEELQLLSTLAVDILDRNLYERANDCRWWAQSPAISTLNPDTCKTTLKYINSLYTVYSNIFVFNKDAKIISTSRLGINEGLQLDESFITDCLSNFNKLSYTVSEFDISRLYDNRGTYIYSAPIFEDKTIIGGVGLVFDSGSQFKSILDSVNAKVENSTTAFIKPNGYIISQTKNLPINIPSEVKDLANGQSVSYIHKEGDQCYFIGASCSKGYREFKKSDGYVEPVIAIMIVPCGKQILSKNKQINFERQVNTQDKNEIATFYLGEQLIGIAVKDIIECIELSRMVQTPSKILSNHVAYTEWKGRSLPIISKNQNRSSPYAIVFEKDGIKMGLMIDGLGPVMHMHIYTTQLSSKSGQHQVAKAGSSIIPILTIENLLE